MLFITFSSLWSVTFFFLFSYVLLLNSLILYVFPLVNKSLFFASTKSKTYFRLTNSFDFFWIMLTPLCIKVIIVLAWVSPPLTVWFGHLVIGGFQLKLFYFLSLLFTLYLLIFTTTHYFTSSEIFDYAIILHHTFYWVYWLFAANSIFTVIFIIEVINILIFLLVVTSTFSSAFFYKNLSYNYGHFLSLNSPYSYLQSLLYLFWISLISSLTIFLFLLFFYLTLNTFDWVLSEYIFIYLLSTNSPKDILSFGLVWLIFLLAVFLKCGVAPVYFWKPTFFQGLPLNTLLFYITFIYFNFLLFTTHFVTLYLGQIFYYYVIVFWLLIMLCLFTLLLIITESYYIKIFLAISSILNSLFIFFILTTVHTSSIIFVF